MLYAWFATVSVPVPATVSAPLSRQGKLFDTLSVCPGKLLTW